MDSVAMLDVIQETGKLCKVRCMDVLAGETRQVVSLARERVDCKAGMECQAGFFSIAELLSGRNQQLAR